MPLPILLYRVRIEPWFSRNKGALSNSRADDNIDLVNLRVDDKIKYRVLPLTVHPTSALDHVPLLPPLSIL